MNIDFSVQAIKSMKKKFKSLKGMSWQVMDMTSMTFDDNAFDIVFDKGALDALMSSECEEARHNAIKLFEGIKRILSPGGKYFCITLAEEYIISLLLSFFNKNGWFLTVDIIPGMDDAPLRPFLVIATRPRRSGVGGIATLSFDSFDHILDRPTVATTEQIQDTVSYHVNINNKCCIRNN